MKICLHTKIVKSSHSEHPFTDLFNSSLKLFKEVACLLSAGSPFHNLAPLNENISVRFLRSFLVILGPWSKGVELSSLAQRIGR